MIQRDGLRGAALGGRARARRVLHDVDVYLAGPQRAR